jgi:hypothetical protein
MMNVRYILLRLAERGCFLYDGKLCDFFSEQSPSPAANAKARFISAAALEYVRTKNISRACKSAMET